MPAAVRTGGKGPLNGHIDECLSAPDDLGLILFLGAAFATPFIASSIASWIATASDGDRHSRPNSRRSKFDCPARGSLRSLTLI